MNTLEIILSEIRKGKEPKIKWMKLSKWCKEVGVSQTFALDCFGEFIARPKGRIYMIDYAAANAFISESKIIKK